MRPSVNYYPSDLEKENLHVGEKTRYLADVGVGVGVSLATGLREAELLWR
jgi:hypothetical protein